ncbi:S1/P1 nuclease-domain-containing protein [Blyttiomyces helicus]|uniref:S1/P1 nuclease-domain-containing protein n=1 Tax=Blyttiomyces helicus TaxID=388810 RepID=A0A4P9W7C0_9FUNG|nr:S1/P1 nuclease-domain-containing protein [Blyttiomyces helicus]|eukprot:RKO88359.1 S1/P1 nuclease-domain-containing protein [Blyttiomyces helicus]
MCRSAKMKCSDVTQPLHICNRERGENDVRTSLDRTGTKLHLNWDVCILVKRIKNDFKGNLTQWVSHLANEIKFDAHSSQAASWISSDSLTKTNSLGHLNASVAWATSANTFDCKVVWRHINRQPMPETKLSGDYYTQSVATVHLQIAKAGCQHWWKWRVEWRCALAADRHHHAHPDPKRDPRWKVQECLGRTPVLWQSTSLAGGSTNCFQNSQYIVSYQGVPPKSVFKLEGGDVGEVVVLV